MVPHGTNSRYVHHRCRCDECRAAHSAVSAAYLSRNRERIRASRNSGECPDCGGAMSSGNGKANDPSRCLACERKRMAENRLPCGTRASYERGCRCRPCTDAVVAYQRRFKKPKKMAA